VNSHAESVSDVRHVDAAKFAEIAADTERARIIDVRTREEYDDGYIRGAELFDVSDPEWPARIDQLDRDTTYLLYCRSGSRSYQAAAYMAQIGFTSLVNLAHGILEWDRDLVRS
jgi:rhodanese-related sulfurtransferase